MDVIVLLIFVSSVLAACSVGAFVATMRDGEVADADRLALAPLDAGAGVGAAPVVRGRARAAEKGDVS
jgi:hypothetical protein